LFIGVIEVLESIPGSVWYFNDMRPEEGNKIQALFAALTPLLSSRTARRKTRNRKSESIER
jgi:hypothetical protein